MLIFSDSGKIVFNFLFLKERGTFPCLLPPCSIMNRHTLPPCSAFCGATGEVTAKDSTGTSRGTPPSTNMEWSRAAPFSWISWAVLCGRQKVLAAGDTSGHLNDAGTGPSSTGKSWHHFPQEWSQWSWAPVKEFCTRPWACPLWHFFFKQPGKCASGGDWANCLYKNHWKRRNFSAAKPGSSVHSSSAYPDVHSQLQFQGWQAEQRLSLSPAPFAVLLLGISGHSAPTFGVLAGAQGCPRRGHLRIRPEHPGPLRRWELGTERLQEQLPGAPAPARPCWAGAALLFPLLCH